MLSYVFVDDAPINWRSIIVSQRFNWLRSFHWLVVVSSDTFGMCWRQQVILFSIVHNHEERSWIELERCRSSFAYFLMDSIRCRMRIHSEFIIDRGLMQAHIRIMSSSSSFFLLTARTAIRLYQLTTIKAGIFILNAYSCWSEMHENFPLNVSASSSRNADFSSILSLS
jgi:hypothetical protein